MSLAGTQGLRLDQAPPLHVPAGFFSLVPVAVCAGGLLLVGDPGALTTAWSPQTIALAHVGTLGVLGTTMLGALYQLLPVVAGSPVPRVGLARVVLVAWGVGVGLLVTGLALSAPVVVAVGGSLLGVALLLFAGPVGVALLRAPTRSETTAGLRVAALALVGVAVLGLRLAAAHAGAAWPADRAAWHHVHLGLGLLGWVGGVLTAVSWQVVPAFYLTPAVPALGSRLVRHGLLLGIVGSVAALAAGQSSTLAAGLLAPAAGAVWLLHPGLLAVALRLRRRRLVDGSAWFWALGLAVAPVVFGLGVAATFGDDPRWGLAFDWCAVWGWAGAIVHGMLGRIVPFLVWFHRFSPRVGLERVPAMRELWPERRLRVGLALHAASLGSGLVAIGAGGPWSVRLTGVLLFATGAWLGRSLASTLGAR